MKLKTYWINLTADWTEQKIELSNSKTSKEILKLNYSKRKRMERTGQNVRDVCNTHTNKANEKNHKI